MSELLKNLQWRYATKKMNYDVIVVTNPEVRAQILPHAWSQQQVTDCSHLLVFAAWDNYTAERINTMFDLVNEKRGFKNQGWEDYRQMLLNTYPARDAQTNFEHAARQAYIGLGSALIAAAEMKVDSTPMEGFLPEKVDEILGLKERNLKSVLLLPLGYREEEGDWLVNLEKVRRSTDSFITYVK